MVDLTVESKAERRVVAKANGLAERRVDETAVYLAVTSVFCWVDSLVYR